LSLYARRVIEGIKSKNSMWLIMLKQQGALDAGDIGRLAKREAAEEPLARKDSEVVSCLRCFCVFRL
jgi:hypothetical protein